MGAFRLCVGGITSEPLLIERSAANANVVRFMMPTGSLRITPSQAVDAKAGARGPWAQFSEEYLPGRGGVCFRSIGHQNKGADVFLKAMPTRDGKSLSFGVANGVEHASAFEIVPATDGADSAEGIDRRPPSPPTFTLTSEHKAAFVADGVIVLRGLVQRDLVDEALRAINASLPLASAWSPDEEGGAALKYGKGIAHQRAIQDLLGASPLLGVAEQLLGPLDRTDSFGGQVALRWPLAGTICEARAPKPDDQWHIDGMKQQPEHMSPFQLLVGVALSDQPTDDCGNVHVWRGQHQLTFDAVRAQREARQRRSISGAAAAAIPQGDGDPWLGHRPTLPREARVQHRLEAGDVILMHQKLPHAVGLNRSPHIRYQVYYRLRGAGFRPNGPLTSLWQGWKGLDDELTPAQQHIERRVSGDEIEGQTVAALAGVQAAKIRRLKRTSSSTSLATWFAAQGLGDVGKALEEHGYTRMEDVKELGRDDLVNTLDFDEADADKLLRFLTSSQDAVYDV